MGQMSHSLALFAGKIKQKDICQQAKLAVITVSDHLNQGCLMTIIDVVPFIRQVQLISLKNKVLYLLTYLLWLCLANKEQTDYKI